MRLDFIFISDLIDKIQINNNLISGIDFKTINKNKKQAF